MPRHLQTDNFMKWGLRCAGRRGVKRRSRRRIRSRRRMVIRRRRTQEHDEDRAGKSTKRIIGADQRWALVLIRVVPNGSSSGSTGLQPLVMDRKRKMLSVAATGVDAAAWATDLRTLQDIVGKFRDMSIDQTEFACLKGIVIFRTALSSGSFESQVLRDADTVASLQDQSQMALCRHVQSTYPDQPTRFGKLLLMLPSLRSVSSTAIVNMFFKKAIGDIPLERLLIDMYKSTTP